MSNGLQIAYLRESPRNRLQSGDVGQNSLVNAVVISNYIR